MTEDFAEAERALRGLPIHVFWAKQREHFFGSVADRLFLLQEELLECHGKIISQRSSADGCLISGESMAARNECAPARTTRLHHLSSSSNSISRDSLVEVNDALPELWSGTDARRLRRLRAQLTRG